MSSAGLPILGRSMRVSDSAGISQIVATFFAPGTSPALHHAAIVVFETSINLAASAAVIKFSIFISEKY